MLKLPGMDEFVIGCCIRFGQEPILAYDYKKIIEHLMEDGMSHEDAIEYFEFNIIGAWAGDETPCFIVPINEFFVDGEI